MGRAKRSVFWRGRKKQQPSKEANFCWMTPEEAAESDRLWEEKRKDQLKYLRPPKKGDFLVDDLKAYGDWRLPPGHENWLRDRIKEMKETPCPQMFRPPPPRVMMNQVVRDFQDGPGWDRSGKIFKDEYPDLVEMARAFSEPPDQDESEGAVGYDQRYYACPYLVLRVAPPPEVPLYLGPCIMDARRCAMMIANERREQMAKDREMGLKKKAAAGRSKGPKAKIKTNSRCPSNESKRDTIELVLSDFEDLNIDRASGYSSESSLQEFLNIESSFK